MFRYAQLAFKNKAGSKAENPAEQICGRSRKIRYFEMRQKAKKTLLNRPVSLSLRKGDAVRRVLRHLWPLERAMTSDFMFPDLARDDVFRLETARLAALWDLRRCGDPINFAADGKSRAACRASLIPIPKVRLSGSSTPRAKRTPPDAT